MSEEGARSALLEKLTVPGLLRFALPGLFLLLALVLFVITAFIAATPAAWLTGAIGPLMLFLMVLMFSMNSLRVNVTENALVIQNGLFGPTHPLDAIERCEPANYSAMREYGG